MHASRCPEAAGRQSPVRGYGLSLHGDERLLRRDCGRWDRHGVCLWPAKSGHKHGGSAFLWSGRWACVPRRLSLM